MHEAADILRFVERDAAVIVGKVLDSAVANAANNDGLDPEELYVSACYADEGTTLKRWRPRARGRATRIRKRTSHITDHREPAARGAARPPAGPPPGRARWPSGPAGWPAPAGAEARPEPAEPPRAAARRGHAPKTEAASRATDGDEAHRGRRP